MGILEVEVREVPAEEEEDMTKVLINIILVLVIIGILGFFLIMLAMILLPILNR